MIDYAAAARRRRRARARPTKPTLSLNIIVVDKGFIVSAFGQRIGEGCQGPGSGVAVGMKTAAAATTTTRRSPRAPSASRTRCPRRPTRRRATLTANANIPYQVIIGTVDAIRKSDDGQELFPDINFGVPK